MTDLSRTAVPDPGARVDKPAPVRDAYNDDEVSSTYMPRSSAAGVALPAAGWYTDPKDALQRRWWDGSQWTNHVRPVVAAPAPSQLAIEQAHRIDTRSAAQGLVAAIGDGRTAQPASRFAPGAVQPVQRTQPVHIQQAVQDAMTLAPRATPAPQAVPPSRTATWPELPTTNPAAKAAVSFGIASVVLPIVVFSIVAFILGGIGLGRAAGGGVFAVGRKEASTGIVLGIVGLAITATLLGVFIANPQLLAGILPASSSGTP